MATYSTNEFKGGLKIILDGDPYVIVENEFVKPGKGQAFNRVKVKNLLNNKIVEKTFKSGEKVEAADVMELEMQYLYTDGEKWHFMQPDSYEQYEVTKEVVGDAILWIQEEDICKITLWNGNVIVVEAPNFAVLEVTETDPGLKGDTAAGGSKHAVLETGAQIKVPLFIQIGDRVRVDTRTGEYVARVK